MNFYVLIRILQLSVTCEIRTSALDFRATPLDIFVDLFTNCSTLELLTIDCRSDYKKFVLEEFQQLLRTSPRHVVLETAAFEMRKNWPEFFECLSGIQKLREIRITRSPLFSANELRQLSHLPIRLLDTYSMKSDRMIYGVDKRQEYAEEIADVLMGMNDLTLRHHLTHESSITLLSR